MNQYNNNPKYNITHDDNDLNLAGASDLRGLKDAINKFIPRPTANNTQPEQLPSLNFDQYVNDSDVTEQYATNFTGGYNLPSMIQKSNLRTGKTDPVYSISDSYRLPQQNFKIDNDQYASFNQPAGMISQNGKQQQQQQQQINIESYRLPQQNNNISGLVNPRVSASIENIYSKVLTVSKNNNQIVDNDEQPLYMNTPYTAQNREHNRINSQNQNLPTLNVLSPPMYGSWNDSSV
jgi:hypothetical protein